MLLRSRDSAGPEERQAIHEHPHRQSRRVQHDSRRRMSTHPLFRRLGALPVSRIMEAAFSVAAVYMFTSARLLPSDPSSAGPVAVDPTAVDAGNPLYYTINTLIYIIAAGLVVKRPRALWRALTADLLLTSLLGLALVSMMWSDAPSVVFRRWVALTGTTVFAVYLHLRYSVEDQLRIVGWGLGITAVLSILLFTPAAVAEGAFAGMYENKNSLGRMMALSTVVFAFLATVRRPRARMVAFAGFSFALVILANSSTALVVTLTILSLMPVSRILARDMRLAVGVGGMAILGVGGGLTLATSNLAAATSLVGRDATLTGRTDLWQYVIETILQRPWLGYGYETFWLWELPWRLVVDEGAGWTAPNAHNGFLEVGLALGLVGLVLFATGLLRGLMRAIRYLQHDSRPTGSWPLMILCYALLYNITEVGALARNTLGWVLYVTALLAVSSSKGHKDIPTARPRVKQRARRAFPVSAGLPQGSSGRPQWGSSGATGFHQSGDPRP